MGISVTGGIYPYPGAIGNEALRLGDVFTGFDEEKVKKLQMLPKVEACIDVTYWIYVHQVREIFYWTIYSHIRIGSLVKVIK